MKIKNGLSVSGGMLSILLLAFSGCQKPGDIKSSSIQPEKEMLDQSAGFPVSRNKVVHLYKDTVYLLSHLFTREAGEELIIDEGTLIKVNIGAPTGGRLDAGIIINPGGVLLATGTRANPIVFTSNDYTGNQGRNWNGIKITGRSSDNSSGSTGDPADFSGNLSYMRIEFAPLVLAAVGNRTIIDHVQVSYSSPYSSFEIDGGTFDTRNLISFACGGPADFYITRGYSGKMQHLLAYRHPFFGTTGDLPANTIAGLVVENNPDSFAAAAARPFTFPVISNLSVIGPDDQRGAAAGYADTNLVSTAVLTTRSTCFRIRNSLFLGFSAAGWYLNDAQTAGYYRDSTSEFSHNLVQSASGDRLFYLAPATLPPFNSNDFKRYALSERFGNRALDSTQDFRFGNLFDYDKNAPPAPGDGSPVFTGVNYEGTYFGDAFFDRTDYIGAIGRDDWTSGWSNFLPLKTNYNFPH